MKSFRVKDGDLALDASRRVGLVRGQEKLLQDLRLWVMEPFGVGFTTPNFGSALHGLIGSSDIHALAQEVADEVERVVSLYQASQYEKVREAQNQGTVHLFSRREILNRIIGIEAEVVADNIVVTVRIANGVDDELVIPVSVSGDGQALVGAPRGA